MKNKAREVLHYSFTMFTVICTVKYINSLNGFEGATTLFLMCISSFFIGVFIVLINHVRMSKMDVLF